MQRHDPVTLLPFSLTALLATVLALPTATLAQSPVLMRHSGATDPATEGWVGTFGPGVTEGPFTPGGPPASAWFIQDASNVSGSVGIYNQGLSFAQEALLAQNGWTMRVCLKATDLGSPLSIVYGYNSSNRRYDMWFSGNGSVTLMTSRPPTCPIGGLTFSASTAATCHAPDFHLFELVFDPSSQTADLFINGTLVHTGYDGHGIGLSQFPGVAWGAGSSCADGWAAFRLVEFEEHGPACPSTDRVTRIRGFGTVGARGHAPQFDVCGELDPGTGGEAILRGAPSHAPTLFLGAFPPVDPVEHPWGTLVAATAMAAPFLTDARGEVRFELSFDLAPTTLLAQWAVLDPGAPAGIALSNALRIEWP